MIGANMATNDQVMDKLDELQLTLCKRMDDAEEKIQVHERRITTIETSLPLLLNGIADKLAAMEKTISEFKVEWSNWMKYLFVIVIVLILVVAALAGVSKLPDVPVIP